MDVNTLNVWGPVIGVLSYFICATQQKLNVPLVRSNIISIIPYYDKIYSPEHLRMQRGSGVSTRRN